MTANPIPIRLHSFRTLSRVLHGFVDRLNRIDLRYVDPWEQKRRQSPPTY